MNTIVKHRRNGNEYLLLSINGDANPANPSKFISELFNQEKSTVSYSASVCDAQGNIFLAYIDDLIVTSVNGQKPAEILPQPQSFTQDVYNTEPSEFVDEEFNDEELNKESFASTQVPTNPETEPRPESTSEADDDWV